ncbi:MAG TPA: hypothetical protein VFP84_40140 [Kofleriaceae bacterium]|nr:hypothetical protein [Kofleriaceae bacterium]
MLGLALIAACATGEETQVDEPLTSEAASGLSVSAWGNPAGASNAFYNSAVATINGKTIQVSVGDNTGPVYFMNHTNLYWSKMESSTRWGQEQRLGDQAADSKVSLAAFNGYIYMVHTGEDDSSHTWLSKFDPNTETWSDNFQIQGYPSYNGPPAIVAYNNLLYFIASQAKGVMWYATMTPGEVFSAPVGIDHNTSTGRPSAAVLNGKLYVFHTLLAPNDHTLVYGTFDGTSWSFPQHIRNGTAPDIVGSEAAVAVDQGVLHVVHTTGSSTSEQLQWTYFDGCTWAGTEVTLNDWRTSQPPAIAQGGPGLVLMKSADDYDWFWQIIDDRAIDSVTYTHPRLPIGRVPTLCNPVVGP